MLSEVPKLEAAVRERERSNRVLLQFGSEGTVRGDDNVALLTVTLQQVRDAGGSPVFRGASATSLGDEPVIVRVVMAPTGGESNSRPSSPEVSRPSSIGDKWRGAAEFARGLDQNSVTIPGARNEAMEYRYVRERPSKPTMVIITVHWAARLHLAPLEIRFTPPSLTDAYRRRIVVQMPPTIVGPPTRGNVEDGSGGLPLVYETRIEKDPLSSGWISYLVGMNGSRSQGLIIRFRADMKNPGEIRGQLEAGVGGGDLATRWQERLQESTEEMVTDAVGHIRDVQVRWKVQ